MSLIVSDPSMKGTMEFVRMYKAPFGVDLSLEQSLWPFYVRGIFSLSPKSSRFFGFYLKKKPAQWNCAGFVPLLRSPSGAGGNRTRVQTRKPEAFYMFILWLDFRPISEHKHPNHGLSSRLRLAREAKANCIPEFSTPRDQSPQDGGSCEMFSSYT